MNIKKFSIYKPLPFYDPIVYLINYVLEHRTLAQNFATTKNEETKVKLEETPRYQHSIFARNVMQASALSMALVTFAFGLFCHPFLALFRLFRISYYTCLLLCLLLGHTIGWSLALLSLWWRITRDLASQATQCEV